MDAASIRSAEGFVNGLTTDFSELKDPRVVGRCDHKLIDILTISILAVFGGADDWPEIELFGQRRESWLREFLELPNGIPSHDTFRRVFEALDRKQFAACLFQWTQALQAASGGKLIAVDGKTLRASGNRKTGISNLHLVTAWATETGLTLGQVACDDKSNEITAILELLALLDIEGCTITIDAIGCQRTIVEQIRAQKGNYILGLKGNQSKLQSDAQELVEHGINTDFRGMKKTEVRMSEQGHGRKEHRTCLAIALPPNHPQRNQWKDLESIIAVTTQRVIGDNESWETRYYISNLPPKAKPLAQAIRRHWSIENSQHWVLDVAFQEDRRRQSERNGATNLAAVRRLTASLLRQEKTNKRGVKNKRLGCALDTDYLLLALNTAQF